MSARQLGRFGIVAALVVGALLALGAWATASPVGASPDEDFHLGSIWCPHTVEDACRRDTAEDGSALVEAPQMVVSAATCTAFDPEASGECVDGLGAAPAWTNRVDAGTYPGGFYRVMHLFVGDDIAHSVLMMRLVNSALAVVLLGTTLALLSGSSRRMVTYGGLAVAAPMIVYLIASINPSSWAVTGVTVAWLGLHGFYTESGRRRRAVLVGLAVVGAVLAASSRGDAGAFVGVVSAAAVALHFNRVRADLRTLAAPAVTTAVGVVGFFAGYQTEAVTTGLADGPGGLGLLFNNVLALPSLLQSAVTGPLNWLDTAMPAITVVPVAAFATAIGFAGLRATNWRKAVALVGLVGSFCLLPLLMLQLSGAVVGTYVQGRYVTPLVPVILMTALWDPARNFVERLSKAQVIVVTLALVAAHAAALHVQLRRFATGTDVPGFNLDAAVEWQATALSPMTVWALGSLGFTVLVLGLLAVGRGDADEVDIPDEVDLGVDRSLVA